MAEYVGIDVSYHNGEIDWQAVAKSGIDFAMIRAGYGKNNIDVKAETNMNGCEDYGLPFGLYWFSYAYTVEMARSEAKYLIDSIGDRPIYMPIAWDFEEKSAEWAVSQGVAVTPELVNAMACAFCEEIESAGYYAMIYANKNFVDLYYSDETLSKYDLWFARWNSDCGRDVHLWQYACSGSVDGINGNVDMNYAYINFPALIEDKGLTGVHSEKLINATIRLIAVTEAELEAVEEGLTGMDLYFMTEVE